MSHFAEIDAANKVIRVLVGDNNEPDEGLTFMQSLGGTWIKTSYNNNIRFNYAGIGYTYDEGRDAFIPPQPYASWVLDEQLCQWAAPSPRPLDGQQYEWSEINLAWELVDVIG